MVRNVIKLYEIKLKASSTKRQRTNLHNITECNLSLPYSEQWDISIFLHPIPHSFSFFFSYLITWLVLFIHSPCSPVIPFSASSSLSTYSSSCGSAPFLSASAKSFHDFGRLFHEEIVFHAAPDSEVISDTQFVNNSGMQETNNSTELGHTLRSMELNGKLEPSNIVKLLKSAGIFKEASILFLVLFRLVRHVDLQLWFSLNFLWRSKI